jgi:regulator of replication initiation timing
MTKEHDESLRPLKRTRESLDQISTCLTPFISLLDRYNSSVGRRNDNLSEFDTNKIAEAKMAVALSMGTLRYMAARLRGDKIEKNDPLRIELDKMRKILMEFNSLQKDVKNHKNYSKNEGEQNLSKRDRDTMEQSEQINLDVVNAVKKKAKK